MLFCKYKNSLGEPRKGVHAIRIGDIAVIDVLFTLIVAWLVTKLTSINYSLIAGTLFILGAIMHMLFCIREDPVKI